GSTSEMMVFGTPLSAPVVERTGYVLTGWSPTLPSTVPAGNVTYTALWSAVNYVITFDPNGGTGGTSAPMAYGSAISAPNVAKFGYTLTGWSPSLPLTVPAANTTYRAIWVANNYTITFNANGGIGGTISAMAYESPLEAPAVSKAGYTFTSWSPAVPATVPGANTTYIAQWSPNSYTIAFNANGGTGSTSSVLVCGNSLSAPAVTRDGYDFAGWLPALPPTVPVTDTTYTAQWNPKSFTITFNANTGVGGTSGTQLCGATLIVPAVTKEGYSLTGWQPALPTTVPVVGTTYVAQWIINSYTITFDAAGGIGGSITSVQYGTPLSAPTVNKEGHTFTGWSPLVPATVPSHDVTYTAIWSVNSYTITFNANGGFGGSSITQAFGTAITAPAVTKSGYTLTGWSPALPATMPSQSLTLIAIWTPIIYDAIFMVDGIDYKRVPTACGAAIVQPVNPEKPGNFFLGWDPGLPSSMPNQNLTFRALWYVFSYDVSFNLNGGTGTVPAAKTAEYGSQVSLPLQGNIAKTGYIFLGWATTANAAIPLGTFSVPAANVKLYVVWGTNPILVAQIGATTVIDYTNNYIFGLEAGIKQADFESLFVKTIGNARIEITTLAGDFGTGTIVKLVSNLTGLVIKTYQIVVYGDVNGDGNIDGIDAGVLIDYENGKTAWNPIADAAFIKAGDVNDDGNVDSLDAGMTIDFQNKKINIDQTPG
ncbi:MAG: InlB B-repeat-containing protein, partial [Eubacteriales bacterium]